MRSAIGRRVRAAVSAVALSVVLAGCGIGGGGGGGTFASIAFDNDPTSPHSIVKADFDFFDLSLIPNQVHVVNIAPGESVGFGFDQTETQNLVDVTLTWSDASTTVINLLPIAVLGGGDYSYPVKN